MNISSKNGLSIRLLREQEDSYLPEGIILDQIPHAGSKIRPNQHIFVTISKKPKAVIAPNFLNQTYEFITSRIAKKAIKPSIFWFNSPFYPVNICIAQSPLPNHDLVDRKLILYISSGEQKLYIVPNFYKLPCSHFKKYFDNSNIKLDVFHKKGKKDKDGNEVEDRIYNRKDFDRTLVIEERTQAVARKLTEFMNGYDRFAKTIVFCSDIDHAERMRTALSNLNSDLVAKNHKYIMQITGDNDEGKRELDNFINPEGALSSPDRQRNKVVLPEPEGAMMPQPLPPKSMQLPWTLKRECMLW
jgi:hypothetical protein